MPLGTGSRHRAGGGSLPGWCGPYVFRVPRGHPPPFYKRASYPVFPLGSRGHGRDGWGLSGSGALPFGGATWPSVLRPHPSSHPRLDLWVQRTFASNTASPRGVLTLSTLQMREPGLWVLGDSPHITNPVHIGGQDPTLPFHWGLPCAPLSTRGLRVVQEGAPGSFGTGAQRC